MLLCCWYDLTLCRWPSKEHGPHGSTRSRRRSPLAENRHASNAGPSCRRPCLQPAWSGLLVAVILLLLIDAVSPGAPQTAAANPVRPSWDAVTCHAHMPGKGHINLLPLSGMDSQGVPRLTTGLQGGWRYSFDPCHSFHLPVQAPGQTTVKPGRRTDCWDTHICKWKVLRSGATLCLSVGDAGSVRLLPPMPTLARLRSIYRSEAALTLEERANIPEEEEDDDDDNDEHTLNSGDEEEEEEGEEEQEDSSKEPDSSDKDSKQNDGISAERTAGNPPEGSMKSSEEASDETSGAKHTRSKKSNRRSSRPEEATAHKREHRPRRHRRQVQRLHKRLQSRRDHRRDRRSAGRQATLPVNITAVLKFTRTGYLGNVHSLILLQCDPDRVMPTDARFALIQTGDKRRIQFILSHSCCCSNGCPAESSPEAVSPPDLRRSSVLSMPLAAPSPRSWVPGHLEPYQKDAFLTSTLTPTHNSAGALQGGLNNNTVGTQMNGSRNVSSEDAPLDGSTLGGPGGRYMWLLLVTNVALLAVAVIIAGMCTSKSAVSDRPYNYLPALHSSGFSLNTLDSVDYKRQQKFAEYFDYSSTLHKSKALPVLANCEIASGDVDIGQRLGGGLFGDTYLGEWDDMKVAAKRITVGVHQNQLTPTDYAQTVKDIEYLSQQRHKHLVTVFGLYTHARQPYVVTEFIEGGPLKDLLSAGDLSWNSKLKICLQAAEGMVFLHSATRPILHRDLRSANILVDHNEKVKVVDFGMTRIVQRLRRQCTRTDGCYCQKERCALPASVRWTAPEVLHYPQADESATDIFTGACDTYSYAMVLWEVTTHTTPFEDIVDENEVMDIVIRGGRPKADQFVDVLPPGLLDLMTSCWDQQLGSRPAFQQVVAVMKAIILRVTKKSVSQWTRRRNDSDHWNRMRNDSDTTLYLKSTLGVED